MRSVEMDLRSSELSGAMAEMRMWLDERRFEPSVFSCRDLDAGVLVRVDFKVVGEAEAFAHRFRGRLEAEPAAEGGQDRMRDLATPGAAGLGAAGVVA
jgi:hypothetical protein